MKKWENPVVEELEVSATANGTAPADEFDGPWTQIGDLWYRPGDGNKHSA